MWSLEYFVNNTIRMSQLIQRERQTRKPTSTALDAQVDLDGLESALPSSTTTQAGNHS